MALAQHVPLRNGPWGLVASKRLPPGTIIREEEPLVRVELPVAYSMWSDEMEREFYAAQYEDHSKRNHITKAISHLSVAERDLFRQVPTHRMPG